MPLRNRGGGFDIVEWGVLSGGEFRRVARELKTVDRTLPRKFKRKIRDTVKPFIAIARKKVETLPVGGRETSGLRHRVAMGVKLFIPRSAASVRVITSMKDPEEAALPRGLDTLKGWRHPVFGNREKWVQQPGYSWFIETMQDSHKPMLEGLKTVLDEAAEDIRRAGS